MAAARENDGRGQMGPDPAHPKVDQQHQLGHMRDAEPQEEQAPAFVLTGRTLGAIVATARPHVVHSTAGTPTSRVMRTRRAGVRNGVHSSRTPKRQP